MSAVKKYWKWRRGEFGERCDEGCKQPQSGAWGEGCEAWAAYCVAVGGGGCVVAPRVVLHLAVVKETLLICYLYTNLPLALTAPPLPLFFLRSPYPLSSLLPPSFRLSALDSPLSVSPLSLPSFLSLSPPVFLRPLLFLRFCVAFPLLRLMQPSECRNSPVTQASNI